MNQNKYLLCYSSRSFCNFRLDYGPSPFVMFDIFVGKISRQSIGMRRSSGSVKERFPSAFIISGLQIFQDFCMPRIGFESDRANASRKMTRIDVSEIFVKQWQVAGIDKQMGFIKLANLKKSKKSAQ